MSFVPGADRRQFGRKEVSIEALAQASGRAAVRCLIKNISPMGALLEFQSPFVSRGNFRLYVDRKLDVSCQICRQDGNAIGVEFVGITLHELVPVANESATKTQVYEGVQKREIVSSSGFEMRARLFGRGNLQPAVTHDPD